MNKKWFFMGLLLTFTAQAQLFQTAEQTQSPAPKAETRARDLASYLDETRDLHASFTQLVANKGRYNQSSGEMWLAKSGKFFWDYQYPERQKIISNGKIVYQYDIDLEQISVRKRDELVGDIAMKVLSGETKLASAFHTKIIAQNKAPVELMPYIKNQGTVYQLLPKTEQNAYDSVWIAMQGGDISALMIDAGRGAKTVLAFHQLERNQNIPAQKFEFTPPKGVDVVGGEH